MELAGVGPPSGPIFQPGLVELTSPRRDVMADGEPLDSFMHITGPARPLPRDTAAQQVGSWAGISQSTRDTVAECWQPSRYTPIAYESVFIQGRSDR